ncbi:dienelactone hydrolase [Fluviicoccus keumensis]|uniref:Dienelactone hydrolase n=1 Tax=Fluviicoccus keumensis TaxID=1435465 RepID=A0A4Q7ZAY4_9GAMM|nr:dienelactone hydrolase family protein [Fluviicoccus keumensis]RZU47075.1 dienelactone hydrolase [Fluviicoccus keumensis]
MNKAWLLGLSLAAGQALAALHGKDVTYNGGGVSMKGYIVYDDQFKGKRPAVLVVHEWWGLNDYARARADQLAKAGYVAMAVDMYGDGKSANHPDNAMAFMQEATKDTEQTSARFRAAEKLLKANKHTNGKKLAAIGYCFGGAVVLNMARQGEPLKGVASFHGALGAWKPAEPGKVTPKVLVMTGADDNMVPAEAVAKFDEEMKAAKADYRIISYPGAKHSFTNPGADDIAKKFGMPIAYNAEADKASWSELQTFLQDIFK